jgi:hypothetical protein
MDMVRNSLLEDGLSDQLKEAIFEPKMTRSKVKEAMKEGNVRLQSCPSYLLHMSAVYYILLLAVFNILLVAE